MKTKFSLDEFKSIIEKHKELFLFFIGEDNIEFNNCHCGAYPPLKNIVCVNIWNDEDDTWAEWENEVVTVFINDGYDDKPVHIFRTGKEFEKWITTGFIQKHKTVLSNASEKLKKQYLGG